jgi:hypothetical protein
MTIIEKPRQRRNGHIESPVQFAIPPSASVLFVDDSIWRCLWVRDNVPGVKFVRRADRAIECLKQRTFDFVFLDYDLGLGMTSEGVAQYLAETKYGGTIVIHSTNPFGAQVLARILPGAFVKPFGSLTSLLYNAKARPTLGELETQRSGRHFRRGTAEGEK